MSEKTNFKDFEPAEQTVDQAMLDQRLAELRMNRALGKDVDESEIQSAKDFQEFFANRPPAGDYQEHLDSEEKSPLDKGVFPGDVFYKKETTETKATNPDGTPKYTYKEGSSHTRVREIIKEVTSEKVYSITARREVGGQVMVTVVTAKNHESDVDETQLMTEDEARKLLAGAELVDSGIDRENARGEDEEPSTDTPKDPADDEKKPDDSAKVEMPDADTAYKDLTGEQKAVIVRDVEGLVRSIGLPDLIDEYDAQLTKLRNSLIADGGMTKEEAEEVIKKASYNVNDYEPAEFPDLSDDDEDVVIPKTNPDLDAAVAAVNEKDPANAKKSYAEMLKELEGLSDEERDEKLSAIWEGASEEERQKLILAAFGPEEYATIRPEDVASWESGTIQRIVLDALNNGEPQAKTEGLNDLERSEDRIENLPQPEGLFRRGRNWARERWGNMENRRLKVAAVLGTLAAGAAVYGAVYFATRDHGAALDSAQSLQSGLGLKGAVGETLANGNWNIPNGGGLLEAMRTNGVDTAKLTSDVAQHLVSSFPTEFEWHGSDIWISNPGNLSSQAASYLESLK